MALALGHPLDAGSQAIAHALKRIGGRAGFRLKWFPVKFIFSH